MTTEADKPKDFLGMSDDDFLNASPPPVVSETDEQKAQREAAEAAAAAEQAAATPAEEELTAAEKAVAEEEAAEEAAAQVEVPADKVKAQDGGKVETDPNAASAAKATPEGEKPADKPAEKADDKAKDTAEDKTKAEETPVDYQAFFKQVMAPFKANGRTIELKTPEEAIRLMQMGAGYGRKIQDLQPALKTLKMLEKANLLDEGKLSFLIDINNKNPDAIKKLIKESGIDPLDLNIQDNVGYTPTSHSVSDKEMKFHSAVDDLKDNPSGQETLRLVNQTWDQESKAALYENPEILSVIQSQRENGIYAQITAEIDRQKTLGQISPTTPFLQAYKLAGDHLTATKGFKVAATTEAKAQPEVIATRVEAPKAQVQNSDKAAAAAETKTSGTRKAGAKVNPLELPDDQFMKQFEGRL